MRKKSLLMISAVSLVWVARTTVEPSEKKRVKDTVTNERLIAEKEVSTIKIVKELKCGIPEIDAITQELRDRFQSNKFGRPPKVLGRADLARVSRNHIRK